MVEVCTVHWAAWSTERPNIMTQSEVQSVFSDVCRTGESHIQVPGPVWCKQWELVCHRLVQSWVTELWLGHGGGWQHPNMNDFLLQAWTVASVSPPPLPAPSLPPPLPYALSLRLHQHSLPSCSASPPSSSSSSSSTSSSSPSLCPPWLMRPESHDVSLHLLVSPLSPGPRPPECPPTFLFFLSLPWNHPLALPPTHKILLIPPWPPPHLPPGLPLSGGATARKERGWWLLAGPQKTERTFTGNSISGWITLSCAPAPECWSVCPILISSHLHPSDQIWPSGKSFIQSSFSEVSECEHLQDASHITNYNKYIICKAS